MKPGALAVVTKFLTNQCVGMGYICGVFTMVAMTEQAFDSAFTVAAKQRCNQHAVACSGDRFYPASAAVIIWVGNNGSSIKWLAAFGFGVLPFAGKAVTLLERWLCTRRSECQFGFKTGQ